MKRKTFLFLFSIALTLSLGNLNQVLACSCVSERPACEAFGGAAAVFIGKVVGAKEQKTTNYDGAKEIWDVGEIYFEVKESFSGVKKGARATIRSGTGGGDCGYWFKRGETYLIYAYGDEKKGFGTNICTRTRPLSNAADDLAFLQNLPRKGAGIRIFGNISEAVKNPDEQGRRQNKPLLGVNLKIQQTDGSKRAFEISSDALGNYEISNIPAGKYKIIPALTKNTKINEYSLQEFEVGDRGCIERNFWVQNDSRVAGRLVDDKGNPISKVQVELIPAGLRERPRGLGDDTDWTDEDGTFEFEEIPSGRYILAVNFINAPDDEAPFPPTFYPNATDRTNATILEIGAGQKFDDLEFRLPVRLLPQIVQGTILWADGTAASEVEVHLEDLERLGWCVNGCSSKTDKNGNFELKAYTGRSYRIRASGDKIVNGAKKEFFAEMPTFTMNGEIKIFRLILNLNEDPAEKDKEKKTENEKPLK